jgi:transporter family-2 protein
MGSSATIGIAAAAAGGAGIAVQSAVMGRFGQRIGTVPAVTFSMLVGAAVAVALLAVVHSSLQGVVDGLSAPKWLWLAGALGTFVILSFTVAAPRIGVTSTLALLIAGQLATGVLVDRLGWFGVDRIPFSLSRLVGLVLLLAGAVVLIRK